ncbi:MAG TPA: arginase family protein [Methylocella sp.]|nr:arginase family protein [Methylocella sp.]
MRKPQYYLLMQIALIAFEHCTDSDHGTAAGPEALLRAGLAARLRALGHSAAAPKRVTLATGEEEAYGAWNRIGLANGHLARLVADALRANSFPLVLQSNCYAAAGVLAGLLRTGAPASLRPGMVWIDAHGDCNTPETTLSGMLSGMPVAIATGLCLERFRKQAGLDPPLDPRDVVMVCVRANDPLEQELIDQSGMETVPVNDIRGDCRRLRAAMERLSRTVDSIYVHFDADALDEKEVASMWLTAPDGPTITELAAALRIIMGFPKVAAFGVADINPERDEEGQMVEAALSVAEAAMAGLSR